MLYNVNLVFSRLTVINFLEDSETGTKCCASKGEGVDRQPILLVQMICSHDISADSGRGLVFCLKSSHSPYIRHRQKGFLIQTANQKQSESQCWGVEGAQTRRLPPQPSSSTRESSATHQEELSLLPRPLLETWGRKMTGAECWRSSPEHHFCCMGEA